MRAPGEQRPAAVVGAAAVGAFGVEWRGLGAALAGGSLPASGGELGLEPLEGREVARARKLMSRGARLAALAMRRALADAGWSQGREEIGAWLGVGASGGAMDELEAMLRASADGGHFSHARFGEAGLLACNPLLAFQLMNNFTLCHGAILEGVAGPNAAFFSRGSGTVLALMEALHALAEGDCARALAGGADTALHPVTRAELAREGRLELGLQPAEGAGVLALAAEAPAPLAWVTRAAFGPWREEAGPELDEAGLRAVEPDLIVLAAWGDPARASLLRAVAELFPTVSVLDASRLGESLAATPALAWSAALDRVASGAAERALVVSAGVDGDLGAVALAQRRP